MRVVGEIPWEELRMLDIFVAFSAGSPALDGFLTRRPETVASLLEQAAEIDTGDAVLSREELASCMRHYAQEHGAPEACERAAASFAKRGTLAIVTGQQPGLFGGPLYTWHKIATALALAERVRAIPDAPDVVTVFWNHSDDHDWGEANHTFLMNPALDVQRLRLPFGTSGKPLSAIEVGEAVGHAVDEAGDLFAASEAARGELDQLRPRAPAATLGQLTSQLLFRHFGRFGLLIVEPASLPLRARASLTHMHGRAEELRQALHTSVAGLVDRGFDIAIDPEGPFLFQIDATGKRRAVPDGEPGDERTASPGVLLRSVWQDQLLPTLAYVAGPGEIAYLALTRRIYDLLGVRAPQIVPRASMTHVEPRLWDDLASWGLRVPDLELGPKPIEERIAASVEPEVQAPAVDTAEEALLTLAQEFRDKLRAIESKVSEVDPRLCHPLSRIGSRAGSELKKFVQKLGNQRRNRAGRFRQHARRLCGELMPRGRLQERVFPALPFTMRRPGTFAADLVRVADPFATAHLLVRAADDGET